MSFEDQSLLVPLFGEFDANLVQVENRLGVFISARGDQLQIEGPQDSVARARDTLQAMYDRLAKRRIWMLARLNRLSQCRMSRRWRGSSRR